MHTLLTLVLLAALQAPSTRQGPRNVAILVYPGVELLDFAGPCEVFASGGRDAFNVYTVAEKADAVRSLGVVQITPQYTVDNCPPPDILVIPGGGIPAQSKRLQAWVTQEHRPGQIVMSVCNGAHLLAAAGLLKDREVTTHHSTMQGLIELDPTAKVMTNRRFVDHGSVITTAGISAGIDGALHLVERLHGRERAQDIARYMEYDWRPDELAKLHAEPPQPFAMPGLDVLATLDQRGVQAALQHFRSADGGRSASAPSESELNQSGYARLDRGDLQGAVRVFELVAAAFPASANAYDSLSEACEEAGQRPAALEHAKRALACLAEDKQMPAGFKTRLQQTLDDRIARLNDPKLKLVHKCPPCGNPCDQTEHEARGACPGCGMHMEQKTAGVTTPPRAGS